MVWAKAVQKHGELKGRRGSESLSVRAKRKLNQNGYSI